MSWCCATLRKMASASRMPAAGWRVTKAPAHLGQMEERLSVFTWFGLGLGLGLGLVGLGLGLG